MQPSKLAALEMDTTGGAPVLPSGSCVQLELDNGVWQHWSGKPQSSCHHALLASRPGVDAMQQPCARCYLQHSALEVDKPRSLSPRADTIFMPHLHVEAARVDLDLTSYPSWAARPSS